MNLTLFLILLTVVIISEGYRGSSIDYYWRNFNGDTPDDAVIAGRDASGKSIYIGQGFFLNTGLLPGSLIYGSTEMNVTAVQKVFTAKKFIKILCSRHYYNFRWITVKYEDIALLTNVHIVEGGTETNSVVHIGRARHEGDLRIGKVYNIAPYQGVAFPTSQGGEAIYKNFDILVYDFNTIYIPYDSSP